MPIAEPVRRYDPSRHRRRSIRLPEHGYAAGVYFVTLCTHGRTHLFGEVVDETVRLSTSGEIAQRCWEAIPTHFLHAVVDVFVVMPNHVHGIVGLAVDPAPNDGPTPNDGVGAQHAAPLRSVDRNGRYNITAGTLPTVVRSFKSAVTKRINEARGTPGARVWQRNYYERVLRNERELDLARRYVHDNPARWYYDRYHPDRLG